MSDTPLFNLNDKWRLAHDEALQWILQRRRGNPRNKSAGYVGTRFHTSHTALLHSIEELCGNITPAAESALLTISQER